MKSDDIRWSGHTAKVAESTFKDLGDQHYRMELQPAGIVFELDRLRRHSDGVFGELSVTINGNFPEAKTYDGVVTFGDINLGAMRTRQSWAKTLGQRTRSEDLDWQGFIDEFAVKVLTAERQGKPAVALSDIQDDDPTGSTEAWTLDGGFPVLRNLPMVLFGDASNGKSYFALWLAGKLAEMGVPVLYIDWEFADLEHRRRLSRLFAPMPKGVLYVRCDRPLKQEIDRLRRLVHEHGIGYVIGDSLGFAVEGPAESQEGASAYFRYLRCLGVGSLSIGHTPKFREEGKDPEIFGSIFFKAGARSIWYIDRVREAPRGELQFGLYHRKNNLGPIMDPLGYKFLFRGDRTLVEPMQDIEQVDELAAQLPLVRRIVLALKDGPKTRKELQDELNCTSGTLGAALSRHKSKFVQIGKKYGLLAQQGDDDAPDTDLF